MESQTSPPVNPLYAQATPTILSYGQHVRIPGHIHLAQIVGYNRRNGILYYFVMFKEIIGKRYPYTVIQVHCSECEPINVNN